MIIFFIKNIIQQQQPQTQTQMELDDEWLAWEEETRKEPEPINRAQHYDSSEPFELQSTPAYEARIDKTPPQASHLSISTKSKKVLLNKPVNLEIFWQIPLISYDAQMPGIIKKQIRVTSSNSEDYEAFKSKKQTARQMPNCSYLREVVVKHMDVQKVSKHMFYNLTMVSIGISSKDLNNKRKSLISEDAVADVDAEEDEDKEEDNDEPVEPETIQETKRSRRKKNDNNQQQPEQVEVCSKELLKKTKQVFMNCFVLTIRLRLTNQQHQQQQQSNPMFHEYHVKVFNSGKISFVGVKSETVFQTLFEIVIQTIKQYDTSLAECSENAQDYEQVKILVNSKFNCGFCVHQENLCELLLKKYDMNCIYSKSNQYSGLRSKFYYDLTKSADEQTGIFVQDNKENNTSTEGIENKAQQQQHRNQSAKLVSYPAHIVRVSYSIFRTGNVLISGRCDDDILNAVYEFVSRMLRTEFQYLYLGEPEIKAEQTKKVKRIWKKLVD